MVCGVNDSVSRCATLPGRVLPPTVAASALQGEDFIAVVMSSVISPCLSFFPAFPQQFPCCLRVVSEYCNPCCR